jgi:prevent-host-death family protein
MNLQTLEPPGVLYADLMAKRELHPAQEVREKFAARVDDALRGIHTGITRHSRPVAVLVDMEWYRRAAEALGEPTDW